MDDVDVKQCQHRRVLNCEWWETVLFLASFSILLGVGNNKYNIDLLYTNNVIEFDKCIIGLRTFNYFAFHALVLPKYYICCNEIYSQTIKYEEKKQQR